MRSKSTYLMLLYADTWNKIITKDDISLDDITEFGKSLSRLRNSLTCFVCSKVLSGNVLCTDDCDHFLCEECENKDFQGVCLHCEDRDCFTVDTVLSAVVAGFRNNCFSTLRSQKCRHLLELKHHLDPDFEVFEIIDILQEGASIFKKTKSEPMVIDDVASLSSRNGIKNEAADDYDIHIEPVFTKSAISENSPNENEQEFTKSLEAEHQVKNPVCDSEEFHDETEADTAESDNNVSTVNVIDTPVIITSSFSVPSTQVSVSVCSTPTTVSLQPTPVIINSPSVVTPRRLTSIPLTRHLSSTTPIRTINLRGASTSVSPKLINFGGQAFRVAVPQGRPVTMVGHVLGTSPQAGIRHQTITLPFTPAELANKKIIVRQAIPFTSATDSNVNSTPQSFAKLQDLNSVVLQYAPSTSSIPVENQASLSLPKSSYTFSTNHISDGNSAQGNASGGESSESVSNNVTVVHHGGPIHSGLTLDGGLSTQDFIIDKGASNQQAKPKVGTPKPKPGCRCGSAVSQPGKLTCCGQRCPCYVANRSCNFCKCKGCRNPHLAGGKKYLQGTNTVIDTKTNTPVQIPAGVNLPFVANQTPVAPSVGAINTNSPTPAAGISVVSMPDISSAPQHLFTQLPTGGQGAFPQLISLSSIPRVYPTISLIQHTDPNPANGSFNSTQCNSNEGLQNVP